MDQRDSIGKMNRRISIYNPGGDSSRDASGRRLKTGSKLDDVWAERQDWSGTENREGGRETASVTTKFIIRYRTDVTPVMIVEEGSDVYDILSVMDFDGTEKRLILNCRKVAA